jgi:alkylation response protein AidB-like acyl-CoA dehydrogenase
MQSYAPPIEDMEFLLNAFDYADRVQSIDAFADWDIDMAMSVLTEIGRFCVQEMLPLNGPGDRQGVRFDTETGAVITPDGFKELHQKFVESGFFGLSQPIEYGGAGAPHTLGFLVGEMTTATNKSFIMCPGLTAGLIDALLVHGTDEQKDTFLPKFIGGEWSGTMCLTEPQCGTDLGLLTTKATPEGDHYRLTGTKIWITFGDHDLTENIVHLVLARLPGAPEGIRGVSVFLVPKLLEDGAANGVTCGGLEHKMGIHASPTCVINFEDSIGYLVGVPHKGMRAMFTMMNAARLQVGLEGVALAEHAYQSALSFAKDRKQGRSLDPAKQDPNSAADNILIHPDVRRMLLNCKASNEGLRGLGVYIAQHLDRSHHHPDEDARKNSNDIVALLTPIIKSYGTERGFANVSEAMQVMGGAGYTQDWPVEQFLRDARIAMIYEGTNHIQALDLVGRKLPRDNGRLLRSFQAEVTALIRECTGDENLAEYVTALKAESKRLTQLTMEMGMKAFQDPEEGAAVASNYLNLFALTTLAFIWLKMLQAAYAGDTPRHLAKRQTGHFFFKMVLSEADVFAQRVRVGKAPMMDFNPDFF